jgi:hypothetical protein
MKPYIRFLSLLCLTAIFIIELVSVVQAQDTPVPYPDWRTGNAQTECGNVGYSLGIKFDPPTAGTFYPIPGSSASITVTITGAGIFDWTSNFGIDVVAVKGGPGANVYFYNEGRSGTGLHAPQGFSHITFCWDLDPLTASKTANTEWTREYSWLIDKSVDDNSHTGFTGDEFESNFTIEVSQDIDDYGFKISGTITVYSSNPIEVAFSVTDSIDGIGNVPVDCPSYTVPVGGSVVCSYEVSPNGTLGSLNTATITSSTANVDGTSATATVNWGAPTIVGFSTVNVTDSNGMNWQFSGSDSVSYAVDYDCDASDGSHTNTATIVETDQSDSETVNVDCYALEVSKTANPSYTRDYDWTISKSADQSGLTLAVGEQFLVNYTVIASLSGFADSGHTLAGTITVHNPAPIAATVNSVNDILGGNLIPVDCGGLSFPYLLASGGDLICSYSVNSGFTSGSSGTNTATASIQNTPGGTTDFSGTAAFDFANADVTTLDECIEVTDSMAGALGTVCAGENSHNFSYSRLLGNYERCGTYVATNIASFTTSTQDGEGDDTGSDDAVVNINVPCGGCTLTQGYWKTHSQRGPAPYDDTWEALGVLQEATPFYSSGKTWYQVFWTPPAGNAYYNLAHQFMAAKLNILNGASAPLAVTQAIAEAEGLFNTYTPTTVPRNARTRMLQLATLLDNYNNGVTGPGHCSEQV